MLLQCNSHLFIKKVPVFASESKLLQAVSNKQLANKIRPVFCLLAHLRPAFHCCTVELLKPTSNGQQYFL